MAPVLEQLIFRFDRLDVYNYIKILYTPSRNGYFYSFIFHEFYTFCCIIPLFIMLYKKNECILCSDSIRLWYVYNK